MNKKVMIGIGLVGVLLLSGCASSQPTFNPNNKSLSLVNGKAYYTPVGSGERITTKDDARKLRKSGISCKQGNLMWASPDFKKEMMQKWGTLSDTQKTATVRNAGNAGKVGCSKPLSNKEYQYVLNQQNQQAQNARVSAQIHQQQLSQVSNTLNTASTNMAIQNATLASSYSSRPKYTNHSTYNSNYGNNKNHYYKVKPVRGTLNTYSIKETKRSKNKYRGWESTPQY